MTKQYGFYLDTSSCTGCKACQIACKDKNTLPVGILWRRVVEVQGGEWLPRGNAWITNVFAYNVSSACMHCEQPICTEVCPTKAMSQRKDGIVTVNAKRCMGCRYCEKACPYGAPQFDHSRGVMTKCNFCFDLIDSGKPPACVAACQMRVLHFGNLDELQAKFGTLNEIYPLPEATLTLPSLVVTAHKDAVCGEKKGAHIANPEEI